MPTCVPVRDMKNTAEFTRTVRDAEGPVTVTKNGYDELVVMTPDDYEALRRDAAEAHLLSVLIRSERDLAEGRAEDGAEFVSSLRVRYGL